MTWQLERPAKPALPSSYFWTWDHSTNWVLDDPGLVTFGCYNAYPKRPETFVEDYRRLTDLAAGLGVKGILIWGFLRASHGGIDAGKRVADYAAARGVAILPGIGTTWYGGCFYEGDHPYNMATFLRAHPEARLVNPGYDQYGTGVCPTHPAFVDWLAEGVRWLFREFAIGGANLENGDFVVCQEPRCQAQRAGWPEEDTDVYRMQFLGYDPALRAIEDQLESKLVTYATYTGFVPGAPPPDRESSWAFMRCPRPVMLDRMPEQGVCQWTLSDMVRRESLPLVDYLDDGAPEAVFDNPCWPRGLRSPAKRAVGFLHQASQWWHIGRWDAMLGTIKEGCLRAHRSGLEGVVIHGEVTSKHVPWALNYLAFSHFIHWPEDTLRDFGCKTLGQVLGSATAGEAFIEAFACWEAGQLTEAQRKAVGKHAAEAQGRAARAEAVESWRFWHWLARIVDHCQERYTASFF